MTTKSNAERYGIALLILVVAIASVWAIWGAYSLGKAAGAQEAEARHAKTLISLGNSIDALTTKLNTAEENLAKVVGEQDTELGMEQDHAKNEMEQRLAAVRTGAVRLSVPATSGVCRPAGGDADPPPVAHDQEARTELDPATAESLVAITEEGDAAIRDLNACVDRYNTARKHLTAFEAGNAQVLP